jgi:dihydroorotate dehydrogenase (NAD+) catalytic subunit
VAETIALAEPDLIEIDMSCPNTASDLGQPFGVDCDSAADATRAVVGATQIPVIAKLAPNVPDLGLIAQAVVDAGAQAITAINTMPGMVIDVEAGQPVLSNRVGGVSGPALKAIAVYCVYEVRRAVDVPIIGTGGVSSGGDAVEMLMAGATAVGVGSAVYYRGVEALGDIVAELAGWLQDHAYDSVAQVRDLAHQPRHWSFSASPPPVPEV